MSFWKTSPGPHWSDAFWSMFSCSGIPIAQPIRRYKFPKPESSEYSYFLAKPTDAARIAEFLGKHFQITQKTVCTLPVDRLEQGIRTDWIVVCAVLNREIVGTIVSRFLGATIFQTNFETNKKHSKHSKTSYIDFFCVHPDHQKSGVGSLLLRCIDYYTNELGRSIHFFQKELMPLTHLPPLWHGQYIYREIMTQSTSDHRIKRSSFQKQGAKPSSDLSISFHIPDTSLDTKLYTLDCGNFTVSVAITNTYHTYMNGPVGELLYYRVFSEDNEKIKKKNIAAAIESILSDCSYRFILMDESIPHLKQMNWVRDSSYFIYCYNVNPRRFLSVRPEFWF